MSDKEHPSLCEFDENESKQRNIELMILQNKARGNGDRFKTSTKESVLGQKNGLDLDGIDIGVNKEEDEEQEDRRNFQRKSITVINHQFSYFDEDETEEEQSLTESYKKEKKRK